MKHSIKNSFNNSAVMLCQKKNEFKTHYWTTFYSYITENNTKLHMKEANKMIFR